MHTSSSEKEKYDKVWALPGYRQRSPGMSWLSEFKTYTKFRPGQKVIDFGCGMGKTCDWFAANGLIVQGVDITCDAVKPWPPAWNFFEASLWDSGLLSMLQPADFGFCSDVLEHIPEDYLDRVLNLIAKTTDSAFIIVALFPDKWDNMTLHLNVQESDYWHEKFKDVWDSVELTKVTDNRGLTYVTAYVSERIEYESESEPAV